MVDKGTDDKNHGPRSFQWYGDDDHPPSSIFVPTSLIDNITEASKNARTLYFIYLGFLTYCALTVVSTTDRQIILNNSTVKLPLVNLDVPFNFFFLLAPFIAIFIFVYFQLYLAKLDRLISKLPPDYPKEDLYPWLINFVHEQGLGFVGFIQKKIATVTLWWFLPLVLIFFSLWYIRTHEPILSYIFGVGPLILGAIAVNYFRSANKMAASKKSNILKSLKVISEGFFLKLLIVYVVLYVSYIIPQALDGRPITVWGYGIARMDRFHLVDLSYQVLVSKPVDDYENIYWGDFSDLHLEGANFASSVLQRADLRRANLKGANLDGANLQRADLRGAKLQRANLWGAKLQRANLLKADLEGANLLRANLEGANLEEANLEGATLEGATLFLRGVKRYSSRANSQKTDIGLPILIETKGLTYEQLSKVKTLYAAMIHPDMKKRLRKAKPGLFEKPRSEHQD